MKVIAWKILIVFKNNNLVETKYFNALNLRGCLLRLKCIFYVNTTIIIKSNCKTNKLKSNSDMFLEIWIIKSNMERNCLQTKKEHYIYYKKFIGPSSEERKIIYWRVLFNRLQNSWRQILWRSYNILNFPKWNIFEKRSKGMFLIFEIVCIPSYFITSLIYVVIGDQSSFLIAVKIICILD